MTLTNSIIFELIGTTSNSFIFLLYFLHILRLLFCAAVLRNVFCLGLSFLIRTQNIQMSYRW